MGWFWANAPVPSRLDAPQPISSAAPPPGCPMHVASPPTTFPPQNSLSPPSDGSCPVKASTSPPTPTPRSSTTLSKLNPLNYMPSNLSQSRAENQSIDLPIERTMSSIPRGDAESNWEYPSPQQMYNAMLRKGYDDTPQDAVESMVAVHNFLNEGAWAEIIEWERRFGRGLIYGWQECRKRGEGSFTDVNIAANEDEPTKPRLVRFQGRPGDMTPKAKMMQTMGQIYPSKFRGEPPFDRHDWYVQRRTPSGQSQEVRYVIDYYSAPPEPTGEPVFFLDVRPAVDGPTAAAARLMRWGADVWHKASGESVRQSTLG